MSRVLVIADDLTGAAEVAAGAVAFGLSASIHTDVAIDAGSDVVVINTDTRDADAVHAVREVQRICKAADINRFDLIYKKTDSVCRGHVRDELRAAMRELNRPRAVFVPANPSKQRTVRDGIYRIGGIDLHQTEFGRSHARVSSVRELIGLAPSDRAIHAPDAVDPADVSSIAAQVGAGELPAGGIDFFLALLARVTGAGPARTTPASLPRGMRLILCGTRSASRTHLLGAAAQENVPIVFADLAKADDIEQLCAAHLLSHGFCVLMSPDPADSHELPATAVELFFARIAARLCRQLPLAIIFVEGGAVASSVLRDSSLDGSKQGMTLDVVGELAPGVVVLQVRPSAAETTQTIRAPWFVIKPGSYRWPDGLLIASLGRA